MTVHRLKHDAAALYRAASAIDETEPERATVMYGAAIWSDPNHALSMVNLGNIHFRRGDEEEARVLYERARQADPKCPEAHYNLGYLELEGGHMAAGLHLLTRTVELDPKFSDAWYNLGLAWRRSGHPKHAIECFRVYLRQEQGKSDWTRAAEKAIKEMSG